MNRKDDRLKLFEDFIDTLPDPDNMSEFDPETLDALKAFTDKYMSLLPWHQRLWWMVRRRIIRMYAWLDFWVIIPIEVLVRFLRREF